MTIHLITCLSKTLGVDALATGLGALAGEPCAVEKAPVVTRMLSHGCVATHSKGRTVISSLRAPHADGRGQLTRSG